MIKNLVVKNILTALAVAAGSFVLLNLTFMFDYLFQSLIDSIVRLFITIDFIMNWYWFPPLKHTLFVVVIGMISWFIFRSKLGVLYKATYMTVPVAVVLVTLGMFLNRWPWLVITLGGIFSVSILIYLIRTKKSWLYSYSLILVSMVLLIMSIQGVDI